MRTIPLTIVALVSMTSVTSALGAGDEGDSPGLGYFFDDGAIPFIYGSAALTLSLHFFAEPPDDPRLFDSSEGGGTSDGDTVPEIAVAGYALVGGGLMALWPNSARWQHVKGYAEAVLTTLALTEVAKNVFGRHRPSYSAELDTVDLRRSFFSGHASTTAAASLYLGMYLRRHGFVRLRGSSYLPWWEASTYLVLGAIAVGVPATRVADGRHHLSDVITGSLAGAGLATAFFFVHDGIFRATQSDRIESQLTVIPMKDGVGAGFVGRF